MHSILELKYKILYDKSRETLQFFKDYMSDDYINRYTHLSDKNIGIEEKCVLARKDVNGLIENFSLKRYINNGFLLNSGDRVICLPYSLDLGLIHGYFLYASDSNKIESTRPINIYFINSKIKELKDNEVLYNRYILGTAYHIANRAIETLVNIPELYGLPFNLFRTRLDGVLSAGKIENFIAIIMVLDKHFNLKFADWNVITHICKYENNAVEMMQKAYNYAIEENKTDEDFEEIINLLYHN